MKRFLRAAALLGLPLLSLPLPAAAQAPAFDADTLRTATQVREAALADNDAYAIVADLVTEIGPRFAGSEADRAAVVWAQNLLKRQGFENVRANPVSVPHWVRGDIRVALDGMAPFTAVALGGSAGTPDGGVTAPVVQVRSIEELEALSDAQVAERIVFFNRRMERHQDGHGYGETVAVRGKGTTVAEAKGAAAVVIRSVGTSSEDIAHTGSMRYQERIADIAAAALSNAAADALEMALGEDPMRALTVDIGAQWKPDAVSANVIGEIPGQSDEIVLLAGHLDSWDITPGANDDAAGVAIAVEAARIAAEAGGELQRTLRVVLYANEEFGLSGARQYAEKHADSLGAHVLAMEADFGSGAVWKLDSRVSEAALPAIDALAALVAPLGVARGGNEARGGADIGPLREAGVPVLGPVQDGSLYFDVHHTAADTLDRISREGLTQNVAVYATAAYLAAQYGPGFGRLPGAGASE